MTNMNFNDLEKKACRSVFQDGIRDVPTGFLMAQFAVAPLLTDIGISSFLVITTGILLSISFIRKYPGAGSNVNF